MTTTNKRLRATLEKLVLSSMLTNYNLPYLDCNTKGANKTESDCQH